MNIVRKIFGTANERRVKKLQPIVDAVNSLEGRFSALSDLEIQAFTPEFKQRIENGESLDSLLPEAFAVVREASKRTLGLRHYDCQIVGAKVIHDGCVAEMRTGEGKDPLCDNACLFKRPCWAWSSRSHGE
jgi:preprotein translocase subunit SecA